LKFNVDASAVRGKKVAVIDDSIVRGTTLRKLTKLIIRAGAKEVHVRSCSPPVKFPCFYGMDFPTRKELIANNKNIEETKEELGADSLGYLSLSGLLKSVEGEDCEYCTACFSGNYIDEENNHE
jgi:amidophosphoribosyltransferase